VIAGRVLGDKVEVLQGLNEGETIITSGQINLSDGTKISPIKYSSESTIKNQAMKLAEVSIKRPTLVIVLFIVLILGGLLAYKSLNYELLPKFSPSVVSVTTIYPGASPSEVENTVSKKIEDAVSSMENIKKLDTRSFESVSSVIITLNSGTDVDYALNDAQRRINAVLKDLPEDVDPPSLNKFSLDDLPDHDDVCFR
jgi:hypothetical protein